MVCPSFPLKERKVIFFVIEQDQISQYEYRTSHVDVRDIENRKIDQRKVDKVADIVERDPVVKITGMTENRENYSDSTGEIALGNFSQADIELAKAWNLGRREGRSDWEARDVLNYRKANKLTWHEKCDTETMVLVRFEINLFFKHSGGCSECRVRDAAGTDGGGFDE